jgi:hypothetical protein
MVDLGFDGGIFEGLKAGGDDADKSVQPISMITINIHIG